MITSEGSQTMRNPSVVASSAPQPSGRSNRRFWLAWLVFLLAVLAAFVAVILVGALATDPASIPPPG
ncbi:MAG: hypothetical protein KC442_03220 [Thermomicrobiales bacterium]|nr:hypothetical protein [Thermomicrobiales bacterium]